MLLDSAENMCTLKVLRILHKGISKYSWLFKKTKFSHTTLQNVLKDLIKGKYVKKNTEDKLHTSYDITNKGKKLLKQLLQLEQLI